MNFLRRRTFSFILFVSFAELDERVNKLTRFQLPVYPKLVIVLPVSCRCPEMMPTEDDFRQIGFVKYKRSRAAIRERCYKNTIYDFQFNSRNGQLVQDTNDTKLRYIYINICIYIFICICKDIDLQCIYMCVYISISL